MKKSDEEIDSDLMDELLDAMSRGDAEALKAPAAPVGHVIEIHIKPGAAPVAEKDDDSDDDEGMLPGSARMEEMMKKGKR